MSIFNQTYTYWELFIVEDIFSKDTSQILKQFENSYSPAFLREHSIEFYSSIQIALENTQGEYINILSLNNLLHPAKIEKQLDCLQKRTDLQAVGCWFDWEENDTFQYTTISHDDILIELLQNNLYDLSFLLFRRDFLKRVGGYSSKYSYSADYDLLCRMALTGKIENLPQILLRKRKQVQSVVKEQKIVEDQEIQRTYYCNFINQYKSDEQEPILIKDVQHKTLGEVISLFCYSRFSQNSICYLEGEKKLDELLSSVQKNSPIGLNGLCGLACGITYMLRNQLLEGNEAEVLSDLDRWICHFILCMKPADSKEWESLLFYFRRRIFMKDKELEYIYSMSLKHYLIILIDLIYEGKRRGVNVSDGVREELIYMEKHNVFPYKIKKILHTEVIGPHIHKEKEKLSDPALTICIPLRIDSLEREKNLDFLLEYLSAYPLTHRIILVEADVSRKYFFKKNYSVCEYYFIQDSDPVFHRTKYINFLLSKSPDQIVGVWDSDVIIPYNQISVAFSQIASEGVSLAYPYDGRFYMLNELQTEEYIESGNINDLFQAVEKAWIGSGFGDKSVGGAYLVNKENYMAIGGENERFYGWGPEDAERYKRMEITDHLIYRSDGPLFHLYHPRLSNSKYASWEIEWKNRKEYFKICSMESEEIISYMKQ